MRGDSVPVGPSGGQGGKAPGDFWHYVLIYVVFLAVSSTSYIRFFLGTMFPATVKGRDLTTLGYLLQALSAVIIIALAQKGIDLGLI